MIVFEFPKVQLDLEISDDHETFIVELNPWDEINKNKELNDKIRKFTMEIINESANSDITFISSDNFYKIDKNKSKHFQNKFENTFNIILNEYILESTDRNRSDIKIYFSSVITKYFNPNFKSDIILKEFKPNKFFENLMHPKQDRLDSFFNEPQQSQYFNDLSLSEFLKNQIKPENKNEYPMEFSIKIGTINFIQNEY